MATSARLLLLVSFVLSFISFGQVGASEVSRSPQVLPAIPSKKVAIRLLSLRAERFAKDYTVALIMPGETTFQGIKVPHAASVTFFGPEVIEGKKKRELNTETFLWTEEYGWFLHKVGERLGRTTVFIWSELKGEVEID